MQYHFFLLMLNLKSKFVFDNNKFRLSRSSINFNLYAYLILNCKINPIPTISSMLEILSTLMTCINKFLHSYKICYFGSQKHPKVIDAGIGFFYSYFYNSRFVELRYCSFQKNGKDFSSPFLIAEVNCLTLRGLLYKYLDSSCLCKSYWDRQAIGKS
jgi:hypothetical protein